MCDKFEELYKINVSSKVEKKVSAGKELSYLSWTWAWREFKKQYPEAKYEIKKFKDSFDVEHPYMFDEATGYMVMTSVTAGDITYEMWLPVMDSNNKAMKSKPYEYQTKKAGVKTVDAATMFDINKALMRCLVKNLAMFGLGLYIYSGEDLPDDEAPQAKKPETKKADPKEVKKPATKKVPTLEERYKKLKDWLAKQTPETFKNSPQAYKNKIMDLINDLEKKGCAGWMDEIRHAVLTLSQEESK